MCTQLWLYIPHLVYKHRFYQQWTSESSFSDAVDFASLPFQPTLRPCLQTTLPSTKARSTFRYLSSIFSYQIFFVCESLSFLVFLFTFFWELPCKQHCIWPRSDHLDQPATKDSSTFSDRLLHMSHSQMLGKFEYGLPAKFWRLVGCTEMLSW